MCVSFLSFLKFSRSLCRSSFNSLIWVSFKPVHQYKVSKLRNILISSRKLCFDIFFRGSSSFPFPSAQNYRQLGGTLRASKKPQYLVKYIHSVTYSLLVPISDRLSVILRVRLFSRSEFIILIKEIM